MKYKLSYKQIRSYIRKSRSVKKQIYWFKRLRNKQIREAERKQDYTRAEYLRTLKSGIRKKVLSQRKYGAFRKQDWEIASDKDIKALVFGGKKAKNNILILDDGNRKIIAYEGTALYDEIIETKKAISEVVGVDDIAEALNPTEKK